MLALEAGPRSRRRRRPRTAAPRCNQPCEWPTNSAFGEPSALVAARNAGGNKLRVGILRVAVVPAWQAQSDGPPSFHPRRRRSTRRSGDTSDARRERTRAVLTLIPAFLLLRVRRQHIGAAGQLDRPGGRIRADRALKRQLVGSAMGCSSSLRDRTLISLERLVWCFSTSRRFFADEPRRTSLPRPTSREPLSSITVRGGWDLDSPREVQGRSSSGS
jgi:hypothetical protein